MRIVIPGGSGQVDVGLMRVIGFTQSQKNTVRWKDKVDAQALRERFGLED